MHEHRRLLDAERESRARRPMPPAVQRALAQQAAAQAVARWEVHDHVAYPGSTSPPQAVPWPQEPGPAAGLPIRPMPDQPAEAMRSQQLAAGVPGVPAMVSEPPAGALPPLPPGPPPHNAVTQLADQNYLQAVPPPH